MFDDPIFKSRFSLKQAVKSKPRRTDTFRERGPFLYLLGIYANYLMARSASPINILGMQMRSLLSLKQYLMSVCVPPSAAKCLSWCLVGVAPVWPDALPFISAAPRAFVSETVSKTLQQQTAICP